MKKFIALLMCFFLCLTPLKSIAVSPKPQPQDMVEVWPVFVMDVETGKTVYLNAYILSYDEYERYVRIEKELQNSEEKIEIYKQSIDKTDKLTDRWDKSWNDTEKRLNKIKIDSERTFLEKYGFELGLGIGILTTLVIVLGVQ